MTPITIVQGGQFGSEGKGQIAAWLCLNTPMEHAVRTGSINAGHTVHFNGGIYKMQLLPTGWVNPRAKLYLGPGCYIEPNILLAEIRMVSEALGVHPQDTVNRLYIDKRCGLHLHEFQQQAKLANRHVKIGATGKGCAEAIISKIANRGTPQGQLFYDWIGGNTAVYQWADVPGLLNKVYDHDEAILLEGTQGTWLDLHLGPYPYTTSRMTTAANWVAESGLSPSLEYSVFLCIRTHPIRVAGNSGPMENEISWPILARTINDRLTSLNLPPRVSEAAIRAFEDHVRMSADDMDIPRDSNGLNQHLWTPEQREEFRVALSDINTTALHRVQTFHPEHFSELMKLFEFTTVTKKLRRVARLDMAQIHDSVMIERPAGIFLTFLNYWYPEFWGLEKGKTPKEVLERIQDLSDEWGVPIVGVTTGPGLEHVHPTIIEPRDSDMYAGVHDSQR